LRPLFLGGSSSIASIVGAEWDRLEEECGGLRGDIEIVREDGVR